MKSLARGYVWWPNLDSGLEHLAATCGTCPSLKALPAEAPLHPWVRASRPIERIHIDFADFKNHSFLILIDNYSKWLEKYRITPHTTTGIAPCELFMNHQLRTRLSLVKPSKDSKVKGSQRNMKAVHDKSTKMRTFEKGDQVAVKSTIQGGKWKLWPGVIHKVLGAVSYLVKCNNRIRYCHIDHLVSRHAELPFSETCSVPSNDLVAPDVHDNHSPYVPKVLLGYMEVPSLPTEPLSLPGEPSNPPSPSVPSTESADCSPVKERPKRTIKTPRKLKDYVWGKR
ncbi:uncharacterized protein LOC128549978 [Mercenaria mercenaria]|uniref:uncharacterized protein LOC128549978 n=1 Tax=Mercenaria mercenaria TaxID=6596 RepID=UPI00234EC005|nr:uncharacterized protein LOC128549978 [Mercenaria mercenaria]